VPIGEKLALRLTAAHLKQEGFQIGSRIPAGTARRRMTWAARSCASADFGLTIDISYEQYQDRFTGFPVYIPLVQVKPGTIAAFYNPGAFRLYAGLASASFDTALAGFHKQLRCGPVRNLHGVIDYKASDSLG